MAGHEVVTEMSVKAGHRRIVSDAKTGEKSGSETKLVLTTAGFSRPGFGPGGGLFLIRRRGPA